MEIWNLVFIQFNRDQNGKLTPLPARHVDTGMGFERICAVINNTGSNYDTDVFLPLMDAIAELAHAKYTRKLDDPKDIAFRVIADHARMSTFAITDGAKPGNKKRDAVVRSVIRRAVRFGYQVLKQSEPFLYKLTSVIANHMGTAFPELRKNPDRVAAIIKDEEASFFATVDRGLGIFDEAAQSAASSNRIIPGQAAFKLHDTFGFPIDLTTQLAQERGLSVDMDEYLRLWDQHVRTSGQGRQQHMQVAVDLGSFKKTDDSLKYTGLTTEASILGFIRGSEAVHSGNLNEDEEAALLLDQTTFYAEQGGQVSDIGTIQTPTGRFDVNFAERKGDHVLHWGSVSDGHIEAHQRCAVTVDARRSDTMRNHTATHLLNWALRKVLGDHIEQKGSLVDQDKLRFDFSHDKPVSAAELAHVERLVNEKIYSDLPVTATIMPLAEAKKLPGVRAVFGEKYPDPVRVIAIGADDPGTGVTPDASIEFCGGTHLSHTGQAGFLKITGEENVAKGVRRITAVTGRGAVEHVQKMEQNLRSISQSLSTSPEEAPKRIATLQEEIKSLKKKLQSGTAARGDPSTLSTELLDKAQSLGGGKLIIADIPGATDDQLRALMDSLKAKAVSYALMLASSDDEKITFVSAVSDDLIAKGLKAGDWIRETAKAAGGGGGGRPQMAQAGGKDPSKLPDALNAARQYANQIK